MQFDRIKPQKGSEAVLDRIRSQIAEGEFPPGSRLPTVVNLAAGFQVGRSTIREALSALKAMGWVDIRHGGGTFVAQELPRSAVDTAAVEPPNLYLTESFREVVEVRKFIESGCAELAAKCRTDEDLHTLRVILARMEASLGDESASDSADVEFHLQVASSSHNSLMRTMMESIIQRVQDNMKESRRLWFFAERQTAEKLLDEHKRIYEAIEQQNAALAGQRMKEHILKVDLVLQQLIRE